MERKLDDLLPILGVENDLILSRQGDITLVYKCELPELFTLSDRDYEAFHQSWVKAIKVLPKHSVFHKQDWFIDSTYKGDYSKELSFLSRSSERFFNERPYLDHSCFIYVSKKPGGRKPANSLLSGLVRRSVVPPNVLKPQFLQEFLDSAGQFKKILEDSGFVRLKRITEEEIVSTQSKAGILERYCYLLGKEEHLLPGDLALRDGIRIGANHGQLYTLGEAEYLPALCGSRINYDKYSTDKTKFSVGFASPMGQLLSCNHIFNQFIFI